MAEPQIPPSKFGAGYTTGGAAAGGAAASYHPLSQGAGSGINHLAVTAFVLVVLFGPFVVPLTLPMSYVAGRRIGQSGEGGAGLAKATRMISYVYLALGVVVLALYLFVVRSTGLVLV